MGAYRLKRNAWRGFALGLLSGGVGTMAMGGYWRIVSALTGDDPRARVKPEDPYLLDDISLIGRHHESDESATAAMGRIAYGRLAGCPPETDEAKLILSNVAHYGYGTLQGGLFGVLNETTQPSLGVAGPLFGSALWLLGDEGAVSLLGLADGPGRFPVSQHLHRWGAHLTYGFVVAATTKALRRLV